MKKFLMIVFALGLILILLSCGAETEDTPTPSFAIDRYAFAEKGYADITAPLPAGWDYSVIEETDDYGNEIFGIRFWPTAYPDLSVRIGWRPGIAVPGKTGAGIRETIPLSNGESLWRHSKHKGDDAQTVTVAWNGYPHMYIADYILPNALESEYEPIIRDILCFTEFGCIRSWIEASNMVTELFNEYHLAGYVQADFDTGAWDIFIDETENGPRRYFHVSAEGDIREYVMEEQSDGTLAKVYLDWEDMQ